MRIAFVKFCRVNNPYRPMIMLKAQHIVPAVPMSDSVKIQAAPLYSLVLVLLWSRSAC